MPSTRSGFSKFQRVSRILAVFAILGSVALYFQNCSRFVASNTLNDLALSSSGTIAASSKVRRLSNIEYKNALNTIFDEQFVNAGYVPTYGNVAGNDPVPGAMQELPSDSPATKLGTDQIASNISSTRFSAYLDIAYALAKNLSDEGYLNRFAGCTPSSVTDLSNTACVNKFVHDFGTYAFRTPPTAQEQADIIQGADSWTTLIGRVLMHPRFLLHYERDGAIDSRGNYALTDYEIEARLASIFWKSSPDAAGLAVAASGRLRTTDGFASEVTRILNDQKAHDVLWTFYQQWFAASRLPYTYNTGALFDSFLSPVTEAQLTIGLRPAILDDAHQFLDYLTWTQQAKLEDIFRSPLIFTTDSFLASLYGVSPRASTTAAPIVDPSGHYRGILSRPIITQQIPSINGETNHIQRGVFILQNIMGMKLGLPASFQDQQAASIVIPDGASTRTQTALKTSLTACTGCHSQINPTGFALAHYDTLGRYQTIENRWNYVRQADGTMKVTATSTNPIDSTTTFPYGGQTYQISDVPSLVDALFGTGAVYDGFAKYYFQFAFGREPASAVDTALLATLKSGLKTKSIKDALAAMAMANEFKTAAPGN